MINIDKLRSTIVRMFYTGNYDSEDGAAIRKRFMHWIKTNKDSVEKLEILKELWDQEKGDPDAIFTEEKFQEVISRAQKIEGKSEVKRKTLFRRRITRVAAVVIPLLILCGVWMIQQEKPQFDSAPIVSVFSVPNGSIKNITLSDNTQVVASAGSVLSFTQTDKQRIVELVGEAFFKVAKNREVPFVVYVEGVLVTVLGTEFNVEAYPDRNLSLITLTEGEVSVKTVGGEEFNITPNQKLIYDRTTGNVEIVYLNDSDSAIAWMDGKLICEQLTLPEMFKTVERHFDIDIEIDPSVVFDDSKYTTEFNHEVPSDIIIDSWKLQTEKFDYVKVDERKIKIIAPSR